VPLGPAAAALVLLAALMHAGWNALVKGAGDRMTTLTLVFVSPAPIALFAAIFLLPAPARASWPFILGSVAVHIGYFAGLIKAYRYGDLSQVYPLARGAAPILAAGLSAMAAGELISTGGMIGVALVSLGTASLAFERGRPRGEKGRALAFALLTVFTIASYTVIDGLGVRRAGTSLGYIAWLFSLDGLPPLAASVLWRRGEALLSLRSSWRTGVIGGLLSFAAYGIAIWAMSEGAIAQVAALRETGVVFAAAIGALFLCEPFGGRRILAASLVAAGVALLQGSA
jgi:drug/metabolite transporter (DMT)-like permease